MRSIAIPAIFLAGALVSRFILAHAPERLRVDLAQPLTVATTWGAFGAWLWIVLACTLALAFVPYVRGLRGVAPSRAATLWACTLSLAAACAWAPLFSSDVYAYAAYGEMARVGLDPYAHLTQASTDPILAAAQWQWSGSFPVCVYGEAFVALAQALTSITHAFGTLAVLDAFRLLSCLALLACAALLSSISTRAAWFLALNPITLWIAAEGHNDTIALAVVLTGFVVARTYAAFGSAIVAAAALIKLPALGAAAAFAIDATIARVRAVPVLAGTALGTALACVGSFALIAGVRNDLAPHGHYQPLASVQALGIPCAVLSALVVLARLRAFATRFDRWCVLALALWIAVPNPYAWYSLWLLAPSAFTTDARVRSAALAVAGASFLRYLPDAVAVPHGVASIALGLCALAAFIPLVL
jgi:hypothetical protein